MFWYDFLIFSTDIPFQKISAPYYVFINPQFWVRCPERSQTWFSSIFKLRVSVPLLLHSQRSRLVLTLLALLWERIRKCLFSSSLHIPLQLYLSIDCSLPDNCCWHPHTLLAPPPWQTSRTSTPSWAVTPPPQRSRSWQSSGSGPSRHILTKTGQRRNSRQVQRMRW